MKLYAREEWSSKKPKDLGESDCPFCDISKIHEYTLWEGKFFYIAYNKFPYTTEAKHLMAIPYEHITHTANMSKEAFSELKEVEIFMKDFFGDDNYFCLIRETTGGKSINHLHYHYLPGIAQASKITEMLKEQGY